MGWLPDRQKPVKDRLAGGAIVQQQPAGNNDGTRYSTSTRYQPPRIADQSWEYSTRYSTRYRYPYGRNIYQGGILNQGVGLRTVYI